MATTDFRELAEQVAGTDEASGIERVRRIVAWMHREFDLLETDYQDRTVDEIVARRGGNCREHAMVLAALLNALDVPVHWVTEINIQAWSPQRRQGAEALVATRGPRASVFGLRHNDHRWLEVPGDEPGEWEPADTFLDLVGIDDWIHSRLGFSGRPAGGPEMIAPVAVMTLDDHGVPLEERSQAYLVTAFDRVYGGRLHDLPAWPTWIAQVEYVTPLAMGAFAGAMNLHDHNDLFARCTEAYAALAEQAVECGLR
jgi:hypothetical protein